METILLILVGVVISLVLLQYFGMKNHKQIMLQMAEESMNSYVSWSASEEELKSAGACMEELISSRAIGNTDKCFSIITKWTPQNGKYNKSYHDIIDHFAGLVSARFRAT